jgi:hypothetical protein
MSMQPNVEQLDERRFLVTVSEVELPEEFALKSRAPVGTVLTLRQVEDQLYVAERGMQQRAKRAILELTHVGEVLRNMPKRSNWKHATGFAMRPEYRLGFTVSFREKRHAAMFKIACVGT